MPEVLASTLPEKPVLTMDGREVGIVHNLTMEQRSGRLDTLLVEPNESTAEIDGIETTDHGHLQIPAAAISGVDDHVVVTLSD